jgi:glycosyltransferase involved in cell wall biosynthesis
MALSACIALAVVAVAAQGDVRWAAAAVLVAVGASAATALIIVRSARRIIAAQGRTERQAAENHKRASVWNFRLTRALGLGSVPAGDAGSPAGNEATWHQSLLTTALPGRKWLAAYALVVMVLAASAPAAAGDLRRLVITVLCTVLAVGAVGAVVRVAERRVLDRQERVERTLAGHHKRASVWNYHLSQALGISQNGPATPAKRVDVVGPGGGGPVRVKRHAGARRLLDAGVFDAEYYSALVDAEFASSLDAASHYLAVNARYGLEPTPFLERSSVPMEERRALAKGDPEPLLSFLRSAEVFDGPLSELFDARHGTATPGEAAAHRGGVLGAFLAQAGASAELPVDPGAPNHGARVVDVRSALVRHARDTRAAARLMGPRLVDTWDSAAEAGWISRARAAVTGDLPVVSVVLPVRDRADLVVTAIRSVQAQSHERWELVVVDDGSTDTTASRVGALAAADRRIRLITGTGRGVSNARNLGLEHATGAYVAFLDSDNTWPPEYLELMLAAMVRDDLGAAYAATALKSASGTRYRAFHGGLDHLLMLNHVDLNVFMVRADVLRRAGRFDEGLRRWVDHDFVIQVAQVSEPVLLPFIGCRYDDSREAGDRITVRESEHWQWAVLGKHWTDWDAAPAPAPGRLSVVIPTYDDSRMTTFAVMSVLRDADASGLDVEVVVIDNGSRIEVGQELLARFGVGGRVRYRRLPRNFNFAIGCNVGAAMASGELVLFLNNDTEVRPGALALLVAKMSDPEVLGAQPLLVYGDETIQTAGTVFTARDALPNHLLACHPTADAQNLRGATFDAVSAAALVMRAADVRALGGFDPLFVNGLEDVDLCLRARRDVGGRFEVVPASVVTHFESRTAGRSANVAENRRLFLDRWRGALPAPQDDLFRAAGFAVAHVGSDGHQVPGPRPVVVRHPQDHRTRWGIHIASPGGAHGDRWGDTHFAGALRDALERAGQAAVVHRKQPYATLAAAYDDVSLVVRGLHRVLPVPGKVNVLWVISHPDVVSVDEVREFDLVFAASDAWSRKMTVRSGREVRPLLQATDPERFTSDVEPVPHGVPVFVGSAHAGRERRMVRTAVEAGVPLAVYGSGWGGLLPDGVLRGQYVANHELAAHYRGATRVLADHWEPMARDGFLQNRLFDAVATGSRVVSDAVDGIEEIFQGAVQTCRDAAELAALCGAEGDARFPSDEEMDKIAAHVRTHHSFDARAQELVEQVASMRSGGAS